MSLIFFSVLRFYFFLYNSIFFYQVSFPDLIVLHALLRTSPKGCPKHQGHKGDPGVTPGTCGAGGGKAQVILVWVRAPSVGNASHPRRLGVMRERP
jgi:hypothetical protein